jgi:hypothetical protein
MDSIVIAVRSNTGVLYASVWIILLSDSYDNNIIITERYNTPVLDLTMHDNNRMHTETYNTPVPDLTAMIWHWSIVCLSMDSIAITALRSGTGVLYVSVWLLLSS